jgi:hypothetical protein
MLYDSKYMILWKGKAMGTRKRSMIARGWVRKGRMGRTQRIFRATKVIL